MQAAAVTSNGALRGARLQAPPALVAAVFKAHYRAQRVRAPPDDRARAPHQGGSRCPDVSCAGGAREHRRRQRCARNTSATLPRVCASAKRNELRARAAGRRRAGGVTKGGRVHAAAAPAGGARVTARERPPSLPCRARARRVARSAAPAVRARGARTSLNVGQRLFCETRGLPCTRADAASGRGGATVVAATGAAALPLEAREVGGRF